MPGAPMRTRICGFGWVPVGGALVTLLCGLIGPARAASERTNLGYVQRVLPATTVALATVPVQDGLRDALSQILNPEQTTDALLGRLAGLSKERTGLDLWATSTLVGFRCAGGEQGVLMRGSFGTGRVKRPDRHIAGLPAISVGDGTYLARLGAVLVWAPPGTLKLLSRVKRGESKRLLGTARLKAFRAAQEDLPKGGANLYLHGGWALKVVAPEDQAAKPGELQGIGVSFLPGRATAEARGSKESLGQVHGLVNEAVEVLRLQHAMLSETQGGQAQGHDRVSRILLMEVLGGLIEGIRVDSAPDRLVLQLSLPRGLNLMTLSLVAALARDWGVDLLEELKLPGGP